MNSQKKLVQNEKKITDYQKLWTKFETKLVIVLHIKDFFL